MHKTENHTQENASYYTVKRNTVLYGYRIYGLRLDGTVSTIKRVRPLRPVPYITIKTFLRPGTTEWNQTCYKDYTWSMLNCNGEFLGKDCSSAKIATYLDVLNYCRLKRAPLSSSLC